MDSSDEWDEVEPFVYGERDYDSDEYNEAEDVGYHSGHTASRMMSETEDDLSSVGSVTPRGYSQRPKSIPSPRVKKQPRIKETEQYWNEIIDSSLDGGSESVEGENYFSESDRGFLFQSCSH